MNEIKRTKLSTFFMFSLPTVVLLLTILNMSNFLSKVPLATLIFSGITILAALVMTYMHADLYFTSREMTNDSLDLAKKTENARSELFKTLINKEVELAKLKAENDILRSFLNSRNRIDDEDDD